MFLQNKDKNNTKYLKNELQNHGSFSFCLFLFIFCQPILQIKYLMIFLLYYNYSMQTYNLLDEARNYETSLQHRQKTTAYKTDSSSVLNNKIRLQKIHNQRIAIKLNYVEKKYQKNRLKEQKNKENQLQDRIQKEQKNIEKPIRNQNSRKKSLSLNNFLQESNITKNNLRLYLFKERNKLQSKVGIQKPFLKAEKVTFFEKDDKNKYRIEKYNSYSNFSTKKFTTKNIKGFYGDDKNKTCNNLKILQQKTNVKPDRLILNIDISQLNFNQVILAINRIKPIRYYSTADVSYKAYVHSGNNSQIIRKCLKNRKNWVFTSQILEANFVWIPYKNRMHFLDKAAQANKDKKQIHKSMQIEIKKQQLYSNNFFPTHYPRKRKLINKLTLQDKNIEVFQDSQIFSIDESQTIWQISQMQKKKLRLYNHFEFNENFCHLPTLYHNLKEYFTEIQQLELLRVPLTFQIQDLDSFTWINYKSNHFRINKGIQKKVWIIKPGRHHKRGVDVFISKCILEISDIVQKLLRKYQTIIIQQYIQPFLYKQRKMDIKCYLLVTSINNYFRAYWYEEGFIRTCTQQYSPTNLKDPFIHLNNESIQKKAPKYGMWESGNKLMFSQFEFYLRSSKENRQNSFYHTIYPNMENIAKNLMIANGSKLNVNRRELVFELFELNFVIDTKFQAWLTQINSDPTFQTSSPSVKKLYNTMLDNSLHIVLDPIFLGQKFINCCQNQFETNKFNIIYEKNLQQDDELLKREFEKNTK